MATTKGTKMAQDVSPRNGNLNGTGRDWGVVKDKGAKRRNSVSSFWLEMWSQYI